MLLNYTLGDAERWAAFSGDYNPIHFDATRAKLLGMDGLCVHGMRALLDIKTALSQLLEKQALSSGGLLFSSRFREPVLCETPYQLSLNEARSVNLVKINSKLFDAHTLQTSISSKLSEVEPLVLNPVSRVNTLCGEELSTLYRQLLAVGNKHIPMWSFFDAVLFRQLVNTPETLETVKSMFPEYKATSLGDIFSLVQVMQTHHETYFNPPLLQNAGENEVFESLNYAIQPTMVMGEKKNGLVIVAGVEAWHHKEPLITVTVTLKTGPMVD